MHNLNCGKSSPKCALHTYAIFKSKQSAIGRKFAQSGHSATHTCLMDFKNAFKLRSLAADLFVSDLKDFSSDFFPRNRKNNHYPENNH
jgi:hypothetical protein